MDWTQVEERIVEDDRNKSDRTAAAEELRIAPDGLLDAGITRFAPSELATTQMCQRLGAIDLGAFIRISLGIESLDFKCMALNYLGRWNLVQLRCSNFMSCTPTRAPGAGITRIKRRFRSPR